jgi:ABC-type uncharacterized transport system substrate-binding protein
MEHRLPAVFAFHRYYRRAADYVDRILRDDKPADLPVQHATKFQMVVNLKTAKASRRARLNNRY